MEELIALRQALQQLQDGRVLVELLKEAYSSIAPEAEKLVISQLDKGERADGSSLPNYSPVSVFKYGKTAGPMNLHNEGFFWEGITLTVDFDGIEVIGRDEKTKMLQIRYGDNIIDLSEENINELNEDHAVYALQNIIEQKLLEI